MWLRLCQVVENGHLKPLYRPINFKTQNTTKDVVWGSSPEAGVAPGVALNVGYVNASRQEAVVSSCRVSSGFSS